MTDRYPIPEFLRKREPVVRAPVERPILFSAPMVRAILAGTKTQTRRVVKLPANAKHVQYWTPPSGKSEPGWADPGVNYWTPDPSGETDSNHLDRCPYGQPGDRLWVRESTAEDCIGSASFARYTADGFTSQLAWWYSRKACPSIHMPRWASRILLEITAVRVERLQDITAEDCWAEGIPHSPDVDPVHEYMELWESINGSGSWAANPWVWVVSFKRVTP